MACTPARAAIVWVCALGCIGCGAEGEIAPAPPAGSNCERLDAYLEPLYALLDEGKLSHLAHAIGTAVPDDGRRDLVAAILALIGAFEPGTFTAVAQALDRGTPEASGEGTGLQRALGGVVRFIAEDGPGAPYPEVLRTMRGTLNSCDGPPTLRLLADAVGDEALLRAIADVVVDGGLSEAVVGLEFEGAAGREALTLLLRNLLVAASSPDFDVQHVIELLGILVDLDRSPWAELGEGVVRLLGPGPGLDALQGLLQCLLDVDPDVALGPLLYDLLVSDAVSLSSLIAAVPPVGEPVLAPALSEALATALRFVAQDGGTRRALVVVLTEVLRDDIGPGVLGDVADLLDAEILGDVVTLLGLVATGSCEAPR